MFDIQKLYDAQSLEGFAILYLIVLLCFSDVMVLRTLSKIDGAVVAGTSNSTSYGTLLQALMVVILYALFIGVKSMIEQN